MQDKQTGLSDMFTENADILSLNARELQMLEFCYIQNMTLEKCASLFKITRARVHQIKERAIRKLVTQLRKSSFENEKLRESIGYWKARCKQAEERASELAVGNSEIKKEIAENAKNQDIAGLAQDIEVLGLSARAHNCLMRHGITRIGDIVYIEPEEFIRIKSFGVTLQNEVIGKMREIGFAFWAEEQERYRTSKRRKQLVG